LIDTKEPVQIRALREQASAAFEIFINFIIVGYCTENWIRYWLKVKLHCDRPVSQAEKLLLCELEMGDVRLWT
jgi:hypothetical protein